MNILKNDFPIFKNNPWIVYLDNAATTLKPSFVIDGISHYLENDYANIHRWAYSLSERSEDLYHKSKEIVAKYIWWKPSEVIYTFNSTYAFNILAQSMYKSDMLKTWDKILVSISEHHANIVPWFIAQKHMWVEVEFINITDDYQIDMEDFRKKYDEKVKVVSFTRASNVSGSIFDLKKLSAELRPDTFFVVDASQAIPSFKVDVNDIECDFLIFTWHKIMASTGIWVLWWRKELLKQMQPSIWWWGSIEDVSVWWFTYADVPDCFEPWTPNLVWAVSLLKAFEYIEKIWWYEKISQIKKELTEYALKWFESISDKVELVWSKSAENRLPVFSFVLKNWKSAIRLWEQLAEKNICIRAWGHCAHPFLKSCGYNGTARASLYIYNDFEDIDLFFAELKKLI